VSLAGACDLALAAELHLGDGAAVAFLGATPRDEPWRYAVASPRALLPLGVPQVVVHGDADDRIPVGSSRDYVRAARRAGDDVAFLDLPRVDHVELIDPWSPAWHATAAGRRRASSAAAQPARS
jgi:pimeloyl-ACP methyl ester carboxylesterase